MNDENKNTDEKPEKDNELLNDIDVFSKISKKGLECFLDSYIQGVHFLSTAVSSYPDVLEKLYSLALKLKECDNLGAIAAETICNKLLGYHDKGIHPNDCPMNTEVILSLCLNERLKYAELIADINEVKGKCLLKKILDEEIKDENYYEAVCIAKKWFPARVSDIYGEGKKIHEMNGAFKKAERLADAAEMKEDAQTYRRLTAILDANEKQYTK